MQHRDTMEVYQLRHKTSLTGKRFGNTCRPEFGEVTHKSYSFFLTHTVPPYKVQYSVITNTHKIVFK